MRECKFFPDIKVEARKTQIDALFIKQFLKRKLPAGSHKILDLHHFKLLLQRVSMVRYPPTTLMKRSQLKSEKSQNSNNTTGTEHNLNDHNNHNKNSNNHGKKNKKGDNKDHSKDHDTLTHNNLEKMRKNNQKSSLLMRSSSSRKLEKIGEMDDQDTENTEITEKNTEIKSRKNSSVSAFTENINLEKNNLIPGSGPWSGPGSHETGFSSRKESVVSELRKSSSVSGGQKESVIGLLRESSSFRGLPNNNNVPHGIKKNGKHRDSMASVETEDSDSDSDLIDPKHVTFAYNKLVCDFLICCDGFIETVWEEMKNFTLLKEGKRYCAATRIQARFRHFSWRNKYLNFLKQLILLQNGVRRYQALKSVRAARTVIDEDWLFRLRYSAVTIITATVRMFLKKCWIYRRKKEIILEQIATTKANRFRLSKIRMKEKRGLLLIEYRRINGFEVVLKVSRRDTRYYSRDYSIIISVYLKIAQSTSRFEMEESDLRMYVERFAGLDAVGVGDLMDKR